MSDDQRESKWSRMDGTGKGIVLMFSLFGFILFLALLDKMERWLG